MANTLGYFNPTFFAQETLILLENSLGLAGRLYRGFDQEYGADRKQGQLINISRPSKFTAQDAPSAPQDLNTDSLQINLSQWKDVKFTVPDNQMAWTGERIIEEHIRPAAYALVHKINQDAAALTLNVSQFQTASDPLTVSNITQARAKMLNKGVPLDGNVHGMLAPDIDAQALDLAAFSQWQGSGSAGQQTQQTGTLGERYGIKWFVDQNTTAMTAAQGTVPTSVTTSGATAKGATSIVLAGTGGSGTLRKGSIIQVGGDPLNQYAVTADVANGTSMTVSVSPPVRAAISGSTAVTFVVSNTSSYENLLFHRNWAAIAFGKLPEANMERMGGGIVSSIADPKTGLSVRARMYAMPDVSETRVALDVLYGMTTLDPDLAIRLRR